MREILFKRIERMRHSSEFGIFSRKQTRSAVLTQTISTFQAVSMTLSPMSVIKWSSVEVGASMIGASSWACLRCGVHTLEMESKNSPWSFSFSRIVSRVVRTEIWKWCLSAYKGLFLRWLLHPQQLQEDHGQDFSAPLGTSWIETGNNTEKRSSKQTFSGKRTRGNFQKHRRVLWRRRYYMPPWLAEAEQASYQSFISACLWCYRLNVVWEIGKGQFTSLSVFISSW